MKILPNNAQQYKSDKIEPEERERDKPLCLRARAELPLTWRQWHDIKVIPRIILRDWRLEQAFLAELFEFPCLAGFFET